MDSAAEIFGIFYSQWDYQMVNISRISTFLTWHGFDDFGWNDPNRNSKSDLDWNVDTPNLKLIEETLFSQDLMPLSFCLFCIFA